MFVLQQLGLIKITQVGSKFKFTVRYRNSHRRRVQLKREFR